MPRASLFRTLLAVVSLALLTAPALAGRRHHGHHHAYGPVADCGPAGCGPAPTCEPQVVTKTIMVPHIDYKTMTVSDVVCKPVFRQKTVPITRMVPETIAVTRSVPVVTPEARTRTVTYQVCHMNYDVVNDTITIQVPHTEMRQGTRTECRTVTDTVMRTVTECSGYCDWRTYVDCHGCVQTCRIWVPQTITKQVPVTVSRPEYVEVPYEYPVTVCRPEVRNITRRIPKPTYETKTREVHFTVPVTNYVERQFPKTVFRPVTEDKLVTYTEMVQEQVERVITVPVCTMVPKVVTYTVGCGGCATCGH